MADGSGWRYPRRGELDRHRAAIHLAERSGFKSRGMHDLAIFEFITRYHNAYAKLIDALLDAAPYVRVMATDSFL